jgi:hypothetical protein
LHTCCPFPVPCPPLLLQNALTRDVFTQLRTISSQQSKIREMKNKLALFRCWLGWRSRCAIPAVLPLPSFNLPATLCLCREALARQESAVQELLVVRRVPAAYKQCLAECVRR